MLEAENKRNKRNKIRLVLIIALFLLASQVEAQYRHIPVSDSAKVAILTHVPDLFQLNSFGSKVSRKNMPIFCKWELDIQDQTGIPIKFRLGSQEYVDKLEQKTITYK